MSAREHLGCDCARRYVTVTIPATNAHEGYAALTIELPWECIECGEERGEPFDALSYELVTP